MHVESKVLQNDTHFETEEERLRKRPMRTEDVGKRRLQKVLEKNWKKLCYANLARSDAGNMEVVIPVIFHMEKA